MLKKRSLLLLFILVLFAGCSSKTNRITSYNQDKNFPLKASYNYELSQNLDYEKLYKELQFQYKDWKGVKYKYGGNTKKGIDCSAFVQRTFKDRLNLSIPRTTALQSKVGKEVSIQNAEIGDLVFFKTSYKYRHVGIYLGEGKFLHASTKKGVTISRLDNPYYESHFWKIKRVIN